MIIFKDDKKEKHQSHEAHFYESILEIDYYGNLEIVGYGKTKDEALKNLKLAFMDMINKINETINTENEEINS